MHFDSLIQFGCLYSVIISHPMMVRGTWNQMISWHRNLIGNYLFWSHSDTTDGLVSLSDNHQSDNVTNFVSQGKCIRIYLLQNCCRTYKSQNRSLTAISQLYFTEISKGIMNEINRIYLIEGDPKAESVVNSETFESNQSNLKDVKRSQNGPHFWKRAKIIACLLILEYEKTF